MLGGGSGVRGMSPVPVYTPCPLPVPSLAFLSHPFRDVAVRWARRGGREGEREREREKEREREREREERERGAHIRRRAHLATAEGEERGGRGAEDRGDVNRESEPCRHNSATG